MFLLRYVWLLCSTLAVAQAVAAAEPTTERIIGGEKARKGEWGSYVMLLDGKTNRQSCGTRVAHLALIQSTAFTQSINCAA